MKFFPLTDGQIVYIYNERMKKDFPEEELRPLANIEKCMNEGFYEFLGFADEADQVDEADQTGLADGLIGYITFTKQGQDYLVDYLAIESSKRNKGFGSELMRQLASYLPDANSILIEVENPRYAQSKEERRLRDRRLNFYLKNKARNTGVEVTCFGVPFLLMEFVGCHNQDEIRELYQMHYKRMLPREMYEANICV